MIHPLKKSRPSVS